MKPKRAATTSSRDQSGDERGSYQDRFARGLAVAGLILGALGLLLTAAEWLYGVHSDRQALAEKLEVGLVTIDPGLPFHFSDPEPLSTTRLPVLSIPMEFYVLNKGERTVAVVAIELRGGAIEQDPLVDFDGYLSWGALPQSEPRSTSEPLSDLEFPLLLRPEDEPVRFYVWLSLELLTDSIIECVRRNELDSNGFGSVHPFGMCSSLVLEADDDTSSILVEAELITASGNRLVESFMWSPIRATLRSI